ncbi:MAG: replication initiation protein [Chlamydiota bacterium]
MNKLIKQPYHITCSRNDYNIHEQRVLIRILEKLQKEMVLKKTPLDLFDDLKSGVTLSFKVKDFMLRNSKNYFSVRNSLDSLMSKDIGMRGSEKNKGCYFIKSKLISEYKYYLNNEFVEVTITKSVLAYLLSLSPYTRYCIDVAFNTQSPYTSRIYQYISHWRDKYNGFIMVLKVDTVKELLSLGSKYKRANSIRQVILLPAMKELKEKADIWFSIKEPIKEGRKVVGWKLQLYKRKETSSEIQQLSSGKEAQESKRREAIFIEQERKNLLALAERFKNKTK